MDARSFLRRTVGTEGYYCLFVLERGEDGTSTKKTQRFFEDIEALVVSAEGYDERGFDAYFSLATFKDDSNRYAANALQMRSLYLDLDCGEDKANPPGGGRPKGYLDQAAALRALTSFCRGYGLPDPLVVNSGNGVHVYWTLTEPVSPAEWGPVANALKEACVARDLYADPAVTADAARILRIPGTRNYKSDPPTTVKVWEGAAAPAPVELSLMAELLGADAVPQLAPMAASSSKVREAMSAMQAKLSNNLTSRFRTIIDRTIAGTGCAQLGNMLRAPEAVDEPTWRAGLSIASHCADSERAIHFISEGHPDYNAGDTERKARSIAGPYTCAKFDDFAPGTCEQCPHWEKIKSPIVLGRELEVADEEAVTVEVKDRDTGIVKEYDVPKLPKPYVRGSNGGVYKLTEDEDGNPDHVLIYAHDLYVIRRAFDAKEGYESVLLRLHLPKDGVREFSVALHVLHSRQEFSKALASQGVTARGEKQWTAIGYYIMDWIEELQMTTTASTARRQFGWTEGMESFLLGDREYGVGVVRNNTPTPMTQQYIPAFKPKGSLADWTKLMDVYNQPGMEVYQLVMCASFGSPLMAFMPDSGLTIHLNSSTGYGKTTLQLAALSAWGEPELLALADKDTDNSKLLRLEAMKNMPVVFDEMTSTAPSEISDLVYAITQGRQRNRMAGGANVERIRGEPWALIAISSGNASFYDKLDVLKSDNRAEKSRVLEIRMATHVRAGTKANMSEFERKVKRECYGFAGDEFIKYVVNNKESVLDLILGVQARLDDAAGLVGPDRFISSGLSCSLAAGLLANKLGLLNYDMKHLFNYTVALLGTRRGELDAAALPAPDLLSAYLAENTDKILRIDSVRRGGGDASLVVPDAAAHGSLVARYEPDVKMLYLMPKPFRAWCAKQQLSYDALLAELCNTYKLQRNVKRLVTKGTPMEPLHAKVVIVDMDIPSAANAAGEPVSNVVPLGRTTDAP